MERSIETTIAVIVILYFLPSVIGWKKQDRGSIIALNIFLGWTLIGWVVALAWALKNDPSPTVIVQASPASQLRDSLLCPACGRYSDSAALFCASCGNPLRVSVVALSKQCLACGKTPAVMGSRFCSECGGVARISN